MKLKAMTLALFAVGLLAGLTLIAPATGADPPTTSGTTTAATTTTTTTTTTAANNTTATDPITALSATSITVGPLTCSIGSSSPKAGDFKVGDRAKIYCTNGVLVFLSRAETTPPPTTTTTTTKTEPNYTSSTDAIKALSVTSITVGQLTCSLGSSSPKTGDFKLGDRVKIYCADGVLLYLMRAETPPTTTTTTSEHHDDEISTRLGTISALSSTSITVEGLTCTIGASSPSVPFKAGDKVGIGCAGGVLVKIGAATGDDHHDDLTTRLGTISALSPTSITVDGLTCSVGERSPSLTGFKVGDRVGIGCANGVLVKIGTPQVEDDNGFRVAVQLGPIVAISADSITVGKLKCGLATTSPSVASYKVGDRVGIGCAGGILFMIGTLPSLDSVSKGEVKHALVKRFNGCIKHGNEKCIVKGILHRLVHK